MMVVRQTVMVVRQGLGSHTGPVCVMPGVPCRCGSASCCRWGMIRAVGPQSHSHIWGPAQTGMHPPHNLVTHKERVALCQAQRIGCQIAILQRSPVFTSLLSPLEGIGYCCPGSIAFTKIPRCAKVPLHHSYAMTVLVMDQHLYRSFMQELQWM